MLDHQGRAFRAQYILDEAQRKRDQKAFSKQKRAIADAVRLGRRPVKACVVCGEQFANNRDNFACNLQGHLRSTCKQCALKEHVPSHSGQQECPCCGQYARLYRDRNVTARAIMLCRPCLQSINFQSMQTEETRRRVVQYIAWRDAEGRILPVTPQPEQNENPQT